jgi:hypothetical protein
MPPTPPGTITGNTGVPEVVQQLPDAAITKGVASGANGSHVGVYGSSQSNTGVYAESKTSIGLYAIGNPAAQLDGDVTISGNLTLKGSLKGNLLVTGDINLTTGDIRFTDAADCAEDFTIGTDLVDPGTVLVLGPGGSLFPSQTAYDKRVVGVVSGAGNYKPGIVLDSRRTEEKRQPVALMGKVYCKVDADHGPVAVGDLLTTSPTLGHAMKADLAQAFGAVIGKALQPLKDGRGLIPILVALQ